MTALDWYELMTYVGTAMAAFGFGLIIGEKFK